MEGGKQISLPIASFKVILTALLIFQIYVTKHMLHTMKLTQGPFEKILSGAKTLEARLFDEKRQLINLGDEIEFLELSDVGRIVKVKVIALLRYRTFVEMLDDLPTTLMGYPESKREYLRTSMYEVYSKEEEDRNGVLGIRMELV